MSERQSFYVGVKGLIRTEQGVLIVRDSAHDKWELPGGRIDPGESMEESFAREMDEEIPGAQIHALGDTVHAATGDFIVENEHRLLLVFRIAEVTLPEVITLGDEHTSHDFVGPNTLAEYELYTTDRQAIEKVFELA